MIDKTGTALQTDGSLGTPAQTPAASTPASPLPRITPPAVAQKVPAVSTPTGSSTTALAPDDPSNKFNTATGQPNPNYKAPVTTPTKTDTGIDTTTQTAQYDANGNLTGYKNNATGTVTSTAPAASTAASDYLNTFTPPPSEDENYQKLLGNASGLINSINSGYQDELNSANAASAARVNAGGLAGSSAGGQVYTEAQQPIIDKRNQALAEVYNNIQNNATSLTKSEQATAESNAQTTVAYQKQVAADALAKATQNITALAANHFDFNAAKVPGSENYQTYQNLLTQVGGDPNVLSAMFAMSAPAENVVSSYFTSDGSGGTTVNQVVQDPVTGKIQHVNYDVSGIQIPNNWTPYKLGTNATRFESPNYNPQDPSTYSDVSVDPTNSGAVTVTSNGVTTVNGIPINNNPSDSSSASGQTPTTTGAAPTVASLIGLGDPTQPLTSVINNVNIGLEGIVNGIIANEGGSPKGVVNNPGNIKVDTAKALGLTNYTDSGVSSTDGGNFASFNTKQDGITGIGAWVQRAANKGETFDQAINAYTGTTPAKQNNDFGTNALAPTDANASDMYITSNGVNTGLTRQGIYQAALDYAADQKLPPTGLGSSAKAQGIRTSIVNKASAIVSALGMTLPQYQQAYKANSSAITQSVQRLAKIDSTSSSLSTQFPRLAELAKSVGTGITESDIQAGAAAAQEKFGSPDAASYVELIQTVRSDYAALQAGVAGGRGGQFFAQNAESAIPAGLTPQQYLAIQQTIETSAVNSSQAIKNEVSKLASGTNPNATTPSSQITQAQYSAYSSQLKPGEILVQDQNGNIGGIPQAEYDPSQYTIVNVNQ